MRYKNLLPLLAVLSMMLLAACAQEQKPKDGSVVSLDHQSFQDFYNQFMRDSAYQMAHIIFPLEGLPDNADSVAIASGSFRWMQEDWVLHRPFDLSESTFSIEFELIGDHIVVERITHRSGEYGMLRRFAFISDEWYLIYYAGVNQLRKVPSTAPGAVG